MRSRRYHAAQPRVAFSLLVVLLTAACSGDGTGVAADGVQDLDGTPNLIVDTALLARSWIIDRDFVAAGSCTSLEYGITPGPHLVLRFSAGEVNVGDADVFVGDPLQHVDPNGDGNYDDSDGLFEFATCHDHFHLRHYARYELLPLHPDGSLGAPIRAGKIGFCLRDDVPWDDTPPQSAVYQNCGTKTHHGFQGIAKGWEDVYGRTLPGQYFVLDDPASPAPPGEYVIRITVNPPYAPANATDPCPVIDSEGSCRAFAESNYDDNVGETRVRIPARLTALGFGPGARDGSTPLLDDPDRWAGLLR